jgi:hypothetical protein
VVPIVPGDESGGGEIGNVVDAAFKSGICVNVNQQGELVDTGWRVGPSVKVVVATLSSLPQGRDRLVVHVQPDARVLTARRTRRAG